MSGGNSPGLIGQDSPHGKILASAVTRPGRGAKVSHRGLVAIHWMWYALLSSTFLARIDQGASHSKKAGVTNLAVFHQMRLDLVAYPALAC